MLELKGITKKYNVFRAVDDVSFRIEPGEILGYLGPNGAGKTTTIKMLTGLLEPTSGEIFFHGKKIKKDLIEYKKRIGYVPEETDIYPHLSAYDYLLMVGRLRLMPEKMLKEKIESFMELLGLSLEMQSPISSYSKGMVQKVQFCPKIAVNLFSFVDYCIEKVVGIADLVFLIFQELGGGKGPSFHRFYKINRDEMRDLKSYEFKMMDRFYFFKHQRVPMILTLKDSVTPGRS